MLFQSPALCVLSLLGGHNDVNIWVCVPPQVVSTDDSSSAGHRSVSGNSEPLPRGRRKEEGEEGQRDAFLSGSKVISIHYYHRSTSDCVVGEMNMPVFVYGDGWVGYIFLFVCFCCEDSPLNKGFGKQKREEKFICGT